MPEGDTVHLAASRLDRALSGRIISRSDVRVPTYATTDLSGRSIRSVAARGKHLFLRIDGITIHTHLKMQGGWHLYRPGDRWRGPRHEARIVLETSHLQAIGFRIPKIELIPPENEDDVVRHLGPDLLGEDWDEADAIRRATKDPDAAVAEMLVEQTVMAGLGNVYKSEICYLAGLHPSTPVADVDVGAVIRLAKRTIEANRKTGRQITTGDPRRGRSRWVYGRSDGPCFRCGTRIQRSRDARGRATYHCPGCQPDGRS